MYLFVQIESAEDSGSGESLVASLVGFTSHGSVEEYSSTSYNLTRFEESIVLC